MRMNSGNKKLKLLVTGASGFIGQEVSRQLSIAGYHPRLMIRQPGDDCEICHFDADFVQADLRDHKSLKEAVKGADAIIHLGARATFESYKTLKPSILDGSLAPSATPFRCATTSWEHSATKPPRVSRSAAI